MSLDDISHPLLAAGHVFFNSVISGVFVFSSPKQLAAVTLAYASIHYRLHFCNNFFCGLPKYSIHCLHKVLTTVVHIVTNSYRFSHIISTLKSLYWLPILYCINFKMCCITYALCSFLG